MTRLWTATAALLLLPYAAHTQQPVQPRAGKQANGRGDVTRHNLPAALSSEPPITYHGGPLILGTTNLYYIYYGDWNGKDPGGMPILNAFGNAIGGSAYFNINTTYYDKNNTAVTNAVQFSGSIASDYVASSPNALSDADIFGIVSRGFGQGLPVDTNAVYFVLTAPGVAETSGFLTFYCGWHNFGTYNGQTIKYAFVGNASGPNILACAEQTASSPNNDPGADAMISVVAHELEEAVTDPQLDAWYDINGEENADKCAWTFGTTYNVANGSIANMNLGGRDFLVQQNWVNAPVGYCALSLTPNLSITKSHTGNFQQGQAGATYTIMVGNTGGLATSGAVTFTDGLPDGLTATDISGTGWSCNLGTLICSRSDALAVGANYPPVTVTVNVASDAPSTVINVVNVSGGGAPGPAQASDLTRIRPTLPDMTIAKSHTGDFTQGQIGATYTITAGNFGLTATSGTVTVTDTLPAGLTSTAISGTGWNCSLSALSCTRADSLAGGASYPPITLTVNVSPFAPFSVTNIASVSGGGEIDTSDNQAADLTLVDTPATISQIFPDTAVAGGPGFILNVFGSFFEPGAVVNWNSTPLTTTFFGSGQLSASVPNNLLLNTGTVCVSVTNPGGSPSSCVPFSVVATPAVPTLTSETAGYSVWTLTGLFANELLFLNGSGFEDGVTVSWNGTNLGPMGCDFGLLCINVPASLMLTPGTAVITAANPGGAPSTPLLLNIPPLRTLTSLTPASVPAGSPDTVLTVNGTGFTPDDQIAVWPGGFGFFTTFVSSTQLQTTVPSSLLTSDSTLQVWVNTSVLSGSFRSSNQLPFTVGAGGPVLSISKTHSGNFSLGEQNAAYTVTVSNASGAGATTTVSSQQVTAVGPRKTPLTGTAKGIAPTSGPVTVSDTLPSGLSLVSIAGSGWTCTNSAAMCSRTDVLPGGTSYAPITVTVNVAPNAASPLTNSVNVSGGGSPDSFAFDITVITPSPTPDLTLTKIHNGSFAPGQTGAAYTITAFNVGAATTSGAVTVTDTLPAGLTAATISGSGWNCSLAPVSCTRSDPLASGSSYPPITLTVNVAPSAPNSVTNVATVSGGGETNLANDTVSDRTTIFPNDEPGTATLITAIPYTANESTTLATSNPDDPLHSCSGSSDGTTVWFRVVPAVTGTLYMYTFGSDYTTVLSVYPGTTSPGNELACSDFANGTLQSSLAVDVTAGQSYLIEASSYGNTPGGNLVLTVATNPAPGAITSVFPDNVLVGTPGFTLNVYGYGFLPGAVINWNGTPLPTTYLMSANVPASLLATAGTASITVTNPGGSVSSPLAFPIVTSPVVPTLTNAYYGYEISYTGLFAGDFLNSVAGSGFEPGVTVAWNGTNLGPFTPVQFPPVPVPARLVQVPGLVNITAANPGGSASAPLSFTVPPLRTLTSLVPASIPVSGANFNLTVNGSGFAPGDSICVFPGPYCLQSTFLSSSQLQVTVPGAAAASDATLQVWVSIPASNSVFHSINQLPLTVGAGGPVLSVAKTHTGNFSAGQPNAAYTVTVSNASGAGPTLGAKGGQLVMIGPKGVTPVSGPAAPSPTSGAVSVSENPPAGLALVNMAGDGWTCALSNASCTRSDVLSGGASYPPITVTVSVSPFAPSAVTNSVNVSGGGSPGNSAGDLTVIVPSAVPDLAIAKTHIGDFFPGQNGAVYTVSVSNIGAGPTSGTVTVTDSLPAGLIATAISGTGWNCALGALTCTRADSLATGFSYPPIAVTVNVASNAPATVTNVATVTGGGESNTSNDTANDPTAIFPNDEATTATLISALPYTTNQSTAAATSNPTDPIHSCTGAADSATVWFRVVPAGSGTLYLNTFGSTYDTVLSMYAGTTAPGPELACSDNANNTSQSSLAVNVTAGQSYLIEVSSFRSTPGGNLVLSVSPNPPPGTINSLFPDNAVAGSAGFTLNVYGFGFRPGATINWNGIPLPTTNGFTANVPAGLIASAGSASITVVNPGGAASPAVTFPIVTTPVSPSLSNPYYTYGYLYNGLFAGDYLFVSGSGFEPGVTVSLNGNNLGPYGPGPAIPVPASSVPPPGPANITATNPGGVPSAPLTITIPPARTLTGISPASVPAGSAAFTLTVNGTGFTSNDNVCVIPGLYCVLTTFVSANQLQITVPASTVASDATLQVWVAIYTPAGSFHSTNQLPLTVGAGGPVLSVTKTHTGNFSAGQQNATYTVTVSNASGAGSTLGTAGNQVILVGPKGPSPLNSGAAPSPTSGSVNVYEYLPTGLSLVSMAGDGWLCNPVTSSCTRSDVLAGGASYPPITVTVNVSPFAPSSVTNSVTVFGGGSPTNSANDLTLITPAAVPDLTITKTHSGNFSQGQNGATYTIGVSNIGTAAASGMVTVTDAIPAGLTAAAISGTGWVCTLAPVTCTRSDALAAGGAYPPITLTVNVDPNAAASVTNTATVSGGGETNTGNDTASDITAISTNTLPNDDVSNATLISAIPYAASESTIAATSNPGDPLHSCTGSPDSATVWYRVVPTVTGTLYVNTFGSNYDTVLAAYTGTTSPGPELACNDEANGTSQSSIVLSVTAGQSYLIEASAYRSSTGGNLVLSVSNNPVLTLFSTFPDNALAGSAGFTLTVYGNNFLSSSVVNWNGTPLPTTSSLGPLTATVPAGLIAAAGTASITVSNPGGAVSNSLSFPVVATPVVPSLSGVSYGYSISYSGLFLGDFLTNASGSGFEPGVTLAWNGTNLGPYSPGQNIAVPAALFQVPGPVNITATNPGGTPSAAAILTVPALRTLTSLSPASVPAGGGDFLLTVNGTGFTATDAICVYPGPFCLQTAFVSATQLQATVPGWAASSDATLQTWINIPAASGPFHSTNELPLTIGAGGPVLNITKTHSGNFTAGQQNATYTLTVSNASGAGSTLGTTGKAALIGRKGVSILGGAGAPTAGAVAVGENLPTGLVLVAMAGDGWNCTLGTVSCTRSDVLAGGAAYPPVTVTVNVSPFAPPTVTNSAFVSGGGSISNFANDPTVILPSPVPDLTIAKTHAGNFTQGQNGATYSITVANTGGAPTNGTVTVTDTLPTGLAAAAMSGTGWSCTPATVTCTRADSLAAGSVYPAITLAVNVAQSAPASVTNTVTVSGGGESNTANDTASDATTIVPNNDEPAGATLISAIPYTTTENTASDTSNPNDPSHSCTGSADGSTVWFRFVPAASGTIYVNTYGSSYDTVLTVYPGTTSPGGELACNDDSNGTLQSSLSVGVTAGQSYLIEVSSFSNSRAANLVLSVGTTPPPVTVSSLFPDNAVAGSQGFQLDVFVPGYLPGAAVNWNGAQLATTSGFSLIATVPSSLIASPGTASVTVSTPGGGSSNPVPFPIVTAPVTPSLSSIYYGYIIGYNGLFAGDYLSGVTGSGFEPGVTLSWNGTGLGPFTPPQIVTLPSSLLQTPGAVNITATNPGGSPSSPLTLTVPPLRTLTSLSPAGVPAASGGFTLTVNGTGFASGDVICVTPSIYCLPTTFVSPTQLQAIVPGAPSTDSTLQVWINIPTPGGTFHSVNQLPLTVGNGGPVLSVTKTHSGNFAAGQQNATYTVTVSNASGAGATLGTAGHSTSISPKGIVPVNNASATSPTSGAVTVSDYLPSGLALVSMAGDGWNCSVATSSCWRSDVLAGGASYPPITVSVNVSPFAAPSVTNSVNVAGGGSNGSYASDVTLIVSSSLPDLAIAKAHIGNFARGQSGAAYTISVSNVGLGPTVGTVTVADTLPAGLTATAISGTGWNCTLSPLACTRGDALAPGAVYAPIGLTVNVAPDAPPALTNVATVAGGGETNTNNNQANDVTTVSDADIQFLFPDTATAGGPAFTLSVSGSGFQPGAVVLWRGVPLGTTYLGGNLLTVNITSALIASAGTAPVTVTNPGSSYSNTATFSIVTATPAPTVTSTFASYNIWGATGLFANDVIFVGGSGFEQGATLSWNGTNLGTLQCEFGFLCVDVPANLLATPGAVTITAANPGGSASAPVTFTIPPIRTVGSISPARLPAGNPAFTLTVTGTGFASGDAVAVWPGSFTLPTTFVSATQLQATVPASMVATDGTLQVWVNTSTASGAFRSTNQLPLTVGTGGPVLSIVKTHSGNFTQGQQNAAYSITVSNASGAGPALGTSSNKVTGLGPRGALLTGNGKGIAPTGGPVTVSEFPPVGLTLISMAGTGWSCTAATASCVRSDVLPGGASYPAIAVTVNVASNGASPLTNAAAVSGGGSPGSAASDVTIVLPPTPDLTIVKSHFGNFSQGQAGATYTLTVSNSGTGPTSGSVLVTDSLPASLTATGISGTGWACTLSPLMCGRSDALLPGSSYAPITLTVNVAPDAPSSVTNMAAVSGGGESNTGNDQASDVTIIVGANIGATFPDTALAASPGFTLSVTGVGFQPGAVVNWNTTALSTTYAYGGLVTATIPAALIAAAGTATITVTNPGSAPSNPFPFTIVTAPAVPNLTVGFPTYSIWGATGLFANGLIFVNGSGFQQGVTISWNGTNVGPRVNLGPLGCEFGVFCLDVPWNLLQAPGPVVLTATNPGGTASAPLTFTIPALRTLANLSPASVPAGSAGFTLTVNGTGFVSGDTIAVWPGTFALPTTFISPTQLQATVPPSMITSDGTLQVWVGTSTANGVFRSTNEAPLTVGMGGPLLSITKSHSGNFTQGQQNATYTVTVSNASGAGPTVPTGSNQLTGIGPKGPLSAGSSAGISPTTGPVTVSEYIPAGLSLVSMSGTGWNCTPATASCTRSDVLAGGASYPAITVTVNVSSTASSTVTNAVGVTGGGSPSGAANDVTIVLPAAPDLTIAMTHAGSFTQGQTGTTYTMTVGNGGTAPTSGTVTVTDTLPAGLTATGISGTGWNCALAALTCTRSDALAAGSSYPAITVTVNVAADAPSSATNVATVSGGGETNTANDTANDATSITALTAISLATTPAGLMVSVDGGTAAATPLTLRLSAGPHTIAVAPTQPGVTGTQYVFTGWSDSGSASHSITVGTSAATYTASFSTQYQLATLVNPAIGGTITAGGWFDAGSAVTIQATPAANFGFTGFSGDLTGTANPASLTMNARHTVVASFRSNSVPALTASIAGKADGASSTRVWTLQLTNSGLAAATGAQIAGAVLTQTAGTACSPAASAVSAFPVAAGNIAPAANSAGAVTFDFSGCTDAAALFSLRVNFTANGGAYSGSTTIINQTK
jgi:uncharacterized repeat protein (TIGR01451 family)